ncbi:MAG: YcxB family protein [Hyphomicrobium sp.]|nr:YcxB family protein [Hyphomicrobium sp.]
MTEIEYQLAPADLAAYQFASRDRIRTLAATSHWDSQALRAGLSVVFCAIMILVVDLAAPSLLGRLLVSTDYVIGIAFGAALMLALVWLHYFDQRRRLASPDGPILRKATLRLMREGVLITQRDIEIRYGWPVFRSVSEARDLVLLWIEPGAAIAIPKRAFASDKARADFIREAEARMAEAGLPRVGSFG